MVCHASSCSDVDDLEEIGDLEQHVAASQCMLIFLSKGCMLRGFKPLSDSAPAEFIDQCLNRFAADFFSANCLREVDTGLAGDKPLILVHESDIKKGGAPLDAFRADCQSKERTAVFDKGGEVLQWHRVQFFQLVTLKMIAVRALHCMPSYASHEQPPNVHIPGEIALQAVEFRQSIRLYVSSSNPGAAALADEFVHRYKDKNLKLVKQQPPYLKRLEAQHSISRRTSFFPLSRSTSSFRSGPKRHFAFVRQVSLLRKDPDHLTHMLLYLNKETFVGEVGQSLSREVKQARELGIAILLVHENDEACGGCPFDRLFQTTPEELISEGLYRKIAVACHVGPLRPTGLALVARELGATPKRSKVVAVLSQTTSQTLRSSRSVRSYVGWSSESLANFRLSIGSSRLASRRSSHVGGSHSSPQSLRTSMTANTLRQARP